MFARVAERSYLVRSRYVRGLTTAVFAFLALLSAGGFAAATRPSALALNIVIEFAAVALVVRAWRSATVFVDNNEVVARSLLRTRRWPRSEIRGFAATTRPVGMGGWRRRVLGIRFSDGTTRWLTEINCRPPHEGGPTWIDEAVAALDA